jgi:hypothetical protein
MKMFKTKRFILIEIILALIVVIYKWVFSEAGFAFCFSKPIPCTTLLCPQNITTVNYCARIGFLIAYVALCLFIIYLIIFIIYKIAKLIRHAD